MSIVDFLLAFFIFAVYFTDTKIIIIVNFLVRFFELINILFIQKNCVMESQIILDSLSNAYSFDGRNLVSLGKVTEMRELWQGKIFQIGKDIYVKKQDDQHNDYFEKWMTNAEFYEFGSGDDFVNQQFSKVGDCLLFVEKNKAGFKKLPDGISDVFNSLKISEELKSRKKFVLFSDGRYYICCEDKNGEPQILTDDVLANNECGMSFVWGCDGYVLRNNKFEQMPWSLVYDRSEEYHLFLLNNFVFAVFDSTEIRPLGSFVVIKHTDVSDILLTGTTYGNECFHLGDDFIDRVVYSPFDDDCHINKDGSITHEYLFRCDGEEFDCFDVYKIVNGHYTCVHHS